MFMTRFKGHTKTARMWVYSPCRTFYQLRSYVAEVVLNHLRLFHRVTSALVSRFLLDLQTANRRNTNWEAWTESRMDVAVNRHAKLDQWASGPLAASISHVSQYEDAFALSAMTQESAVDGHTLDQTIPRDSGASQNEGWNGGTASP